MNKETFFSAGAPKTKEISIAGSEEKFTIRQVSAEKLGEFVGSDDKTSSARTIAASVINGDGELLFDESDIPRIMSLSAVVITHINREINKLNGLSEPDESAKN